jgi:hypothetical protein
MVMEGFSRRALPKAELSWVSGLPQAAQVSAPSRDEKEPCGHRGDGAGRFESSGGTEGVDKAVRGDPGVGATVQCESANIVGRELLGEHELEVQAVDGIQLLEQVPAACVGALGVGRGGGATSVVDPNGDKSPTGQTQATAAQERRPVGRVHGFCSW